MSAGPSRKAITNYPVLEPIAERYSPYIFQAKSVETEKLLSCFEAAGWAASSFNEQPWRFIVARREDAAEFDRALSCLLDANQVWAKHAGALVLALVSTTFSRNGNPNRVAIHDLGLAMGNFSLQATSLGLQVHQMAGINPSRIRSEFGVPEGIDPVTATAIGYAGDPADSDNPELAARDQGTRKRKPLPEIVFGRGFGEAAPWLAD